MMGSAYLHQRNKWLLEQMTNLAKSLAHTDESHSLYSQFQDCRAELEQLLTEYSELANDDLMA